MIRSLGYGSVTPDLHCTIFVACNKLTTGLLHDVRLACLSEKCRSILKHVLKRCNNCKSCRRPVVSSLHARKIVLFKSALRTLHLRFICQNPLKNLPHTFHILSYFVSHILTDIIHREEGRGRIINATSPVGIFIVVEFALYH